MSGASHPRHRMPMLDTSAQTLALTGLFGTPNPYGSKVRGFASPQKIRRSPA